MNRNISRAIQQVVFAAALVTPFAAHAESNFQTGGSALNATAKVDFQIIIPKVLFLQVGSGTFLSSAATVDLITFDVPAAAVGNGTAVSATAGSGDLGSGAVTARVRGNGGTVTLVANAPAAMSNGAAGDTIDWSQITTAATSLGAGTVLQAPVLATGNSGTVTLTPVGKIVSQDARWTYSYANSAVVPAGTYGGTVANNGRVTYTATLL
jgi:hypothetical protein